MLQALPPVLNPGTGKPITPDKLLPLFPLALIEQEVSQQRWIEIPDAVRSIYCQWRPTPLYRARRLEQAVLNLGLVESRAEYQLACFAAGLTFATSEGILPAPEANHAVKATIDEALLCKQEGRSKTILFNLCGHGHFDMQAYIDYQAGRLVDTEYSAEEVAMALAGLPVVDS